MNNILVVNGSPRGERSHSRRLVNNFLQQWMAAHPDDVVKHREIGRGSIPHIDESWIAAAFTSPDQRTADMNAKLALSDELVDELLEADVIIMGVPMYNWSVPSSVKAYIDQLMRIGRTWAFESGVPDGVYKGLLSGKRMFLISARGDFGYEEGGHNAMMNFQTPYLRLVFGIMGIKDITPIYLENEEYGGKTFAASVAEADRQITEAVTAAARKPSSHCLVCRTAEGKRLFKV